MTQTVPLGVSTSFLRGFRAHPGIKAGMTTTDVCTAVVKPETAEWACPYIDLLADSSGADGTPRVASATVFVSHAWRYKFDEVMSVLLDYADARPAEPQYFWFDLFTNDQNNAAHLPQEWWATTFRDRVGGIGHTLLVMTPWNDPVPLTRAWCLWEILCTLQENAQLTIALPEVQEKAFKGALLSNFNSVLQALVDMKAEKAEAWKKEDREMIFNCIRESVGFSDLNTLVKDRLRSWVRSTGDALLGKVEQELDLGDREEALKAASLQICLGALTSRMGRFDEAISLYRKALDIYTRHNDVKGQGTAHLNIGLSSGNVGKSSDVVKHLTLALKMGQDSEAKRANVTIGLGNAHLDQGDFDQAQRNFEQALAIYLKEHGDKHKSTAFAYSNLGAVHLKQANYPAASEHYQKAVNIYRTVLGEHPSTADNLHGLAVSYIRSGSVAKGIKLEEQALSIYRESFGVEHPFTVQSQTTLDNARQKAESHRSRDDIGLRRSSICGLRSPLGFRSSAGPVPSPILQRRTSIMAPADVRQRRRSISRTMEPADVRQRRRSISCTMEPADVRQRRRSISLTMEPADVRQRRRSISCTMEPTDFDAIADRCLSESSVGSVSDRCYSEEDVDW